MGWFEERAGLAGTVAVVTGGAGSLGRAIVTDLAANGVAVAILHAEDDAPRSDRIDAVALAHRGVAELELPRDLVFDVPRGARRRVVLWCRVVRIARRVVRVGILRRCVGRGYEQRRERDRHRNARERPHGASVDHARGRARGMPHGRARRPLASA